MTRPRSWVEAILAAGAVPASHVPEASLGRTDLEEFTGADPVEDRDLRLYPLADARPLTPGAVDFLAGIEQWRVVGYTGVHRSCGRTWRPRSDGAGQTVGSAPSPNRRKSLP